MSRAASAAVSDGQRQEDISRGCKAPAIAAERTSEGISRKKEKRGTEGKITGKAAEGEHRCPGRGFGFPETPSDTHRRPRSKPNQKRAGAGQGDGATLVHHAAADKTFPPTIVEINRWSSCDYLRIENAEAVAAPVGGR
ncbi:hypothetical protein EYF80_015740 [Liparis tanakae]|uniref:Uncharacterized protein n=1 Tax=Liparis tanakae TaxID=230148 RepID=A0A4Z2I7T0_9TELE|nr:hypothetical protein EYF80_015740 [Liparis tanakae]